MDQIPQPAQCPSDEQLQWVDGLSPEALKAYALELMEKECTLTRRVEQLSIYEIGYRKVGEMYQTEQDKRGRTAIVHALFWCAANYVFYKHFLPLF